MLKLFAVVVGLACAVACHSPAAPSTNAPCAPGHTRVDTPSVSYCR